ncbi:MAG: cytochrome C oxidase subunit IV family protein [Pseudomonadota bacterium]
MTPEAKHDAPHILSPGLLTAVWVALLCLTGLTIAVSRIDLGFWNVTAALGIACAKALLVILFFMHMKYESPLLKWLLFLAFLVLAIYIGMTFFDLAFR